MRISIRLSRGDCILRIPATSSVETQIRLSRGDCSAKIPATSSGDLSPLIKSRLRFENTSNFKRRALSACQECTACGHEQAP
jgi:hypothetical protein